MEIDLEGYEYYVRPGYTDMRKGPYSLARIVQESMGKEPFSRSVFIFCGRTRRTIRAIVWDRNGWIEITKRLECSEVFPWPKDCDEARKVTLEQICGLLAGYDIWRPLPELKPELL